MSAISILSPAVRDYVHNFDARSRRLALFRAVGVALAVFAIWFLTCTALDRVFRFEPVIRLGLLGAGLLSVPIILRRPLLSVLRKRTDWIEAAGQIEQHDPYFGQRLVTVTSRLIGPAEHRGSDGMLRELLRDVDRYASQQNPADLLPTRRVMWPWVLFVAAALAFAGLQHVPAMGMNTLAMRFVAPLADVLPVSTTQLSGLTGSRDVVQSETLQIQADVARLDPGGFVSLFVSEDAGQHWSRTTMERAAAASRTYAFALAAVDRDLTYYITAGDATSRAYQIRVRRPPAVQQFSIRYEYPAYTGRSDLTVVNTDGLIEAPVGTRATLTITATEPLEAALLTLGGEKIPMDRVSKASSDDRVRRASVVVKHDGKYTVDLISDRQVAGESPVGTTLIHAIPDAKPLLRLTQASQSLRLHPREILSLTYQALDDYGLSKLNFTAQVNSAAPVEIPLQIQGDARRQERGYDLDLATIKLAIGDVVVLTLDATDRAGQHSASPPVQILISPRSVDVSTYQRISELNDGAAQAATLNEQLTAASTALEEADREAAAKSLAYLAAINRANRQLTGASESASLMRQAMFRAIVNSRSSELATTIAGWIDQAQVQSWLAEDLFRRADAPTGMGSESRGLLKTSLDTTRALRDELRVVAAGERAGAVLADRENLLASEVKANAPQQAADVKQRLLQSLQRTREDIAAGAKEIGLDPAAADFDAQLKARVDAAANLLKARQPIDFAAAARDWSLAMQRDRMQPAVLDERLFAAAQAEAVRYDADLIRARDLQLAARAAGRIETLAEADPSGRSIGPVVFTDFASAMADVQREHELNRRSPVQTPTGEERKLARDAATRAREFLDRWASDSGELASSGPWPGSRSHQRETEELALRASAETASRNYSTAAKLDAQLAQKLGQPTTARTTGPTTVPATATTTAPTTRPTTLTFASTAPTTAPTTSRLASTRPLLAATNPTVAAAPLKRLQNDLDQTVKRAQTIDRLGEDQDQLAQETSSAQPQQASDLAQRQRSVAEAIGVSPDEMSSLAADPDWRGRATAAVLAAQESLAAMPQQLASAQEALGPWRDAVARADQTKHDADAMPDAQRQPAALRAAAQAARDAGDAGERFEDRRRPVSTSAIRQLAIALEPYAPETDAIRDVIERGLLPAAQRLEESSKAGDAAAFARAADDSRQAIDAAQRELASAQEQLTARDPLVAARSFARAAADFLEKSPPDLRAAQLRQRETKGALSRAWDRTIHDAATLRMSSLPAMQSVYGPTDRRESLATTRPDDSKTASTGDAASGAAEWSRVRPPRDSASSDVNSAAPAARDGEPAGFEEPLRLYFEALNKSK